MSVRPATKCVLWHIRASVSEETAKIHMQFLAADWIIATPCLPECLRIISINCREFRTPSLGTNRRDHITSVLAKLLWLLIWARVTFKIDTFVHKLYVHINFLVWTLSWRITRQSEPSALPTCHSWRNHLLHQCQPLEDEHSASAPSRHGIIYMLTLGNHPL